MSKLSVVSLFSGAGGMDLGFKNAGYDILWANDFDKDAVQTYKRNFGDHIVHGDITKIKSHEIPDNPDIIIGGFPCQGFSVANTKRSMEDKRNFLYKEMLRIIKDKNPKVFLAENVKGLLSMSKGKVLEMIKEDFRQLGYKVDVALLNSANYGVPQARERIFIMGNKIGVDNVFPDKTHADLKNANIIDQLFLENYNDYISVEEAIGFLSDIDVSPVPLNINGRIIHNHIAYTNVSDKFFARKHEISQFDICDYLREWRQKSGISVKRIDQIFGYNHTAGHWFRKDNKSGSIPKPSDWWKLKEILGFDDRYDKAVTEFVERDIVFEQSLRITNWVRPSDTITATGPEIHVNKQRRLSVRECAIIQSFPDNFVFTGSLNSQHRQVGNAVPPFLAQKIAETIKDKMLNKQKQLVKN